MRACVQNVLGYAESLKTRNFQLQDSDEICLICLCVRWRVEQKLQSFTTAHPALTDRTDVPLSAGEHIIRVRRALDIRTA